MPKYHQDDCRRIMDDPTKVRNVTMLGTMGHGKTTLMDNLGAATGFLAENKIGEVLFTHYRADEKEKKSNLKTNSVHMVVDTKQTEVETNKDGKDQLKGEAKEGKYMYCMLDTPGHLDYSPEYAAALRMADSTLCTVSVTDGVGTMMEYMIMDSLKERCKPMCFVNKMDIAIMVLDQSGEDIYQNCSKVVQNMNVALSHATKFNLKNFDIDPILGNVVFGSAFYGWGFTLAQWADVYAKKGMDKDKLLPKLWGDNFFNAKKKVWTKVETDDSKRGFVQFIMDPIINLHKKILAGDAAWETMAGKLGIELKNEDKKLEGKALVKRVMNTWMPASNAVLEMIATHSPDPVKAQKLRCEHLYKGEADSEVCKAMIACDPKGPVMMHAVKMAPTGSAGRFYAIGRLFSGTVTTDKYHIRGPDYDPEDPETFACSQDGRAQSVNLMLGKDFVSVLSVPCGNIVALQGVDTLMTKSATITSSKQAYNFTPLKFNVSCVFRVAIRPTDAKLLPKLVEGLKRLQKSDILVQCVSEPTGDHIVSGCGEEHLKVCLRDLKNEYAGVDFTQGTPTVSYKETVIGESTKTALSKSPNKHNRLYVIACPLGEEVSLAIETYQVNMQQEAKKRARILIDNYGWDKTDCMKIWSFGPNDIDVGGANVLVDQTKGIQYLNELKESVNSGLQWAARQGPLAEENMRGVRFNLMDAKLHADSIHRGMGQIQPTARRVFFGAALTAEPRFMEPWFKVVIACPEEACAGVQQAIMAKRGETQYQEEQDGKTIFVAHLPISETLGNDSFSKVLQTKTSGKALATYAFDHWALVAPNPLEVGSKAETIMLDIRERKGLKVCQPDISDYIDRL